MCKFNQENVCEFSFQRKSEGSIPDDSYFQGTSVVDGRKNKIEDTEKEMYEGSKGSEVIFDVEKNGEVQDCRYKGSDKDICLL